MLSYHADADIDTNPYELGLDRLVNLEMEADFIGKPRLRRIRDTGVSRKQVGLVIEGAAAEGAEHDFLAHQQNGTPSAKSRPRSIRRGWSRTSRSRWSRPTMPGLAQAVEVAMPSRPARPPSWSDRSSTPKRKSPPPEQLKATGVKCPNCPSSCTGSDQSLTCSPANIPTRIPCATTTLAICEWTRPLIGAARPRTPTRNRPSRRHCPAAT
jgi:hypothetical protein